MKHTSLSFKQVEFVRAQLRDKRPSDLFQGQEPQLATDLPKAALKAVLRQTCLRVRSYIVEHIYPDNHQDMYLKLYSEY